MRIGYQQHPFIKCQQHIQQAFHVGPDPYFVGNRVLELRDIQLELFLPIVDAVPVPRAMHLRIFKFDVFPGILLGDTMMFTEMLRDEV